MKIVIKKSKKPFRRSRYYAIQVGRNGETMFTSELVFNKDDLKQTIQTVKNGAMLCQVIDESDK